MSWSALLAIIQDEADAEACQRIEARVRQELGGLTIYLPRRSALTREQAQAAVRRHRGNVIKAAIELGVDRATCYRKLQPPKRLVR